MVCYCDDFEKMSVMCEIKCDGCYGCLKAVLFF